MLKGAHKQMIVVRTRDSRLFEEAHFVMRRGAGEGGGDDLDLVFEANRIIENSLPKVPKKTGTVPVATGVSPREAPPQYGQREVRFNLIAGLVWFFGGFMTGGGLVALLWWIL